MSEFHSNVKIKSFIRNYSNSYSNRAVVPKLFGSEARFDWTSALVGPDYKIIYTFKDNKINTQGKTQFSSTGDRKGI